MYLNTALYTFNVHDSVNYTLIKNFKVKKRGLARWLIGKRVF